jgi:hypothetical protein
MALLLGSGAPIHLAVRVASTRPADPRPEAVVQPVCQLSHHLPVAAIRHQDIYGARPKNTNSRPEPLSRPS